MASLFSSPLTFLSSSPSSSSFLPSLTAIPSRKLKINKANAQTLLSNGIALSIPVATKKMPSVVVKASETDGTAPAEADELPQSENNEEAVQVGKLPLESKLQQKMEQKMKMKMAKKIRLRRKRLLRKRKLRKKGRWPPSKMKKLKNV